jgi:hypothetical protein
MALAVLSFLFIRVRQWRHRRIAGADFEKYGRLSDAISKVPIKHKSVSALRTTPALVRIAAVATAWMPAPREASQEAHDSVSPRSRSPIALDSKRRPLPPEPSSNGSKSTYPSVVFTEAGERTLSPSPFQSPLQPPPAFSPQSWQPLIARTHVEVSLPNAEPNVSRRVSVGTDSGRSSRCSSVYSGTSAPLDALHSEFGELDAQLAREIRASCSFAP